MLLSKSNHFANKSCIFPVYLVFFFSQTHYPMRKKISENRCFLKMFLRWRKAKFVKNHQNADFVKKTLQVVKKIWPFFVFYLVTQDRFDFLTPSFEWCCCERGSSWRLKKRWKKVWFSSNFSSVQWFSFFFSFGSSCSSCVCVKRG